MLFESIVLIDKRSFDSIIAASAFFGLIALAEITISENPIRGARGLIKYLQHERHSTSALGKASGEISMILVFIYFVTKLFAQIV